MNTFHNQGRFNTVFFAFFLIISCDVEKRTLLSDLQTSKGITYLGQFPFSGRGYEVYDDGSRKVIHYFKGKKHGKDIAWYPNGQVKNTGSLKKGKKVGRHTGFWHNGEIRFEKHYSNTGLFHGEQKQWHSNGVLARVSNYKFGKEKGYQKGWRNNGDLRYNYQIIKNKRYGFLGSKTCVSPEI